VSEEGISRELNEFDYVSIFTKSWYAAKKKYPCVYHEFLGVPTCDECWKAMDKTIEESKQK
jgi:hypothetical protein